MKMYLYEGLNTEDRSSMMLWESAGRAIAEANLNPQQITKLFRAIDQEQTAAGGNRTALGMTKDAAGAVNKAYADLKSKVANSGPVKGFDALYDQAAEKLKQATGGDQGAMQYVQKYRDFAKKHPIAQTLIYSALIAAAGISGAGAGGAAALGLLKMTDKLLQGEKFSSAAYSGAKTGGMAYAAGQIGKALKGGDQTTTTSSTLQQHTTGLQPASPWDVPNYITKQYPADKFTIKTDGIDGVIFNTATGQKVATFPMDHVPEGKQLSLAQTTLIIERIVRLNNRMINEGRLEEGIWDDIKAGTGKALGDLVGGVKNVGANIKRGATGQAAQSRDNQSGKYVKTGLGAKIGHAIGKAGHQLTTKITAERLTKAWQNAGSPTDSAQIEKILRGAGVNPEVISTVFKANNIPTSTTQAGAQQDQQQQGAQQQQTALPDVSALTPQQKQILIKNIDKLLATAK